LSNLSLAHLFTGICCAAAAGIFRGRAAAVIFRGRAVAVLRRPPLLFRPPPHGRATASSTGRCCHLTRGCDARWDLPGGALAGRDGSPSGPLLLRDSVFFRAFVPLIFFPFFLLRQDFSSVCWFLCFGCSVDFNRELQG